MKKLSAAVFFCFVTLWMSCAIADIPQEALQGAWIAENTIQGADPAADIQTLNFFDRNIAVINKAETWDYSVEGQSVLLTPMAGSDAKTVRVDYMDGKLILSGSQPAAVYIRSDAAPSVEATPAAASAPSPAPANTPVREVLYSDPAPAYGIYARNGTVVGDEYIKIAPDNMFFSGEILNGQFVWTEFGK